MFWSSYAALWLLTIVQSLILVGVVRSLYELKTNAIVTPHNEKWRGRRLPSFEAVDLIGRTVNSASLLGRDLALLFVSPSCTSCTTTVTEAAALSAKMDGNVVVICRGSNEDCAELTSGTDPSVSVIADLDLGISRLLDVTAVPVAVLVDRNGRIGSYGYPVRDGEPPWLTEGERLQQEVTASGELSD